MSRWQIKSGFTAIEVLLATALASILMIAILSVATNLAAEYRRVRNIAFDQGWQLRLQEEIQWDLSNSEQMLWRPDRFELFGYASHHSSFGLPTHRRVQVAYQIRRAGNRSWLVRSESTPVQLRSETEILAAGVTGIEILSVDSGKPIDQELIDIPEAIQLVLTGEDEDRPIVDRVYFLR